MKRQMDEYESKTMIAAGCMGFIYYVMTAMLNEITIEWFNYQLITQEVLLQTTLFVAMLYSFIMYDASSRIFRWRKWSIPLALLNGWAIFCAIESGAIYNSAGKTHLVLMIACITSVILAIRWGLKSIWYRKVGKFLD